MGSCHWGPGPSCVPTLPYSPFLCVWLPLEPQACPPSGQLRGESTAKGVPALIYNPQPWQAAVCPEPPLLRKEARLLKGQCSGMREVQGKCAEADWGLGKTNPTPQTLLTVIP